MQRSISTFKMLHILHDMALNKFERRFVDELTELMGTEQVFEMNSDEITLLEVIFEKYCGNPENATFPT